MSPFPNSDPNRSYSWWARARNDVLERIEGIINFAAPIAVALGGWRQISLAIALSSLAGGLGICLEHTDVLSGHRWMSFGGFILGLVWPLKKTG